jgi:hypothetical protein
LRTISAVAEMDRVRAQFEALLLQPLLQPLERGFGQYGAIAADRFADALAKALEQRDA